MGKWKHRLAHVDGVLVCENCGDVGTVTHKGRPVCKVGRKEHRGDKRKRHQVFVMLGPARCAICGATDKLVADHDHACCPGRFGCHKCLRGVLCSSCNLGLGHFRDDPLLLEKAREYLAH